jgi:hypothetical protein
MSSDQFDSLQCLGPLVSEAYVAELCEFDERIWEIYREHATLHGPVTHGSRDYLIIRMVYIAEVTSTAIRLNATWSLTPAAMSLLRDRYEQTVRFSWLTRNPSPDEYLKYERAMFGKINSIVRKLEPETIRRFEKSMGPVAPWAIEPLSKEQRAYFEAWTNTNLRDMATKRDAFPPIAGNHVAKQTLAPMYEAIYAQFSSVSHYDRFSIEMVRPEQHDDGTISLTLAPHWPALLILRTATLDIIQCFEATQVCFDQNTAVKFESLFMEWHSLAKKLSVDYMC